jgi:spore maturation protein CgeB
VVNWFCDDHWRYDAFSRKLAPALTLSVTTSSAAAEQYERDGFRHLMSQWGYADKSYGAPTPTQTPAAEIVFVGQPYGSRARALRRSRRDCPRARS